MLIKKVHHVAYRCLDAKQTVEWYGKHLDMKFVLAIAEDEVPSTKLDEVKWEKLEEWARTKRAPKHAAWMHDGSLATPVP